MNPIYQAAIDGTLRSTPTGNVLTNVYVYNFLPVDISGSYVGTNGLLLPVGLIKSYQTVNLANVKAGDCMVFKNPFTGGFISALQVSAGKQYYVVLTALTSALYAQVLKMFPDLKKNWSAIQQKTDFLFLTGPNDIGPCPQPTKTIPVPQDSPLVLVGSGTLPANPPSPTAITNFVTREQYWKVLGDSYSLIPGQERTVSYTVRTGKEVTSSAEAQISTSVGASAGGGWGPVSASISASLNASATAFHQVTVNEQTESFVSDVMKNTSENSKLVVHWQLIDVVTIYSKDGEAVSTVYNAGMVLADAYTVSPDDKAIAPPPAADLLSEHGMPALASCDPPAF